MKFKENDRVVILEPFTSTPGHPKRPGAWRGVIVQPWPAARGRGPNLYLVLVDGYGPLVFDEDQLDLDVLEKLARVIE